MALTGMDAVKEAVPSIAALARDLGVTRGAVAQWTKVPAERVLQVSRITGLSISTLRPDLFAGEEGAQ